MNKQEYIKYTTKKSEKSELLPDCIKAFFVGGLICTIAQGLKNLLKMAVSEKNAGYITMVTLIFCAALLTGIGIFDKIAKFAGAGTLVPITGFANAVVSPAVDTSAEGMILGIGSKIYTIAGPVILYGTVSGVIYGIIYYLYGVIV